MKKIWAKREDGSAIVIALLILTLLTAFVALAVSRTTSETIATSNDAAESRAFSAAQGSLEIMTRNFDKIFEEKLSPAPADLLHVQNLKPPGFDTDYQFEQVITQTEATKTVVMSGQLLQGLNALRDEWQIDTTATDKSNGVQVALRRKFYNNRVPIFQFGIFYDDDLEFHPGPRFDFGGRVHSNDNLFLTAGTGLYFSSRVTAVGQVFTDVGRNGRPWSTWGENVWIKNGAGTYVKLTHAMGSVVQTPSSGTPVFSTAPNIDPDMPTVYKNSSWGTNQALFQGNLLSEQKPLNLPLKIASTIAGAPLDYIELVKRGRNVGDLYNDGVGVAPVTTAAADSIVTSKERYYNKKGLRISLADSKAKLPGCASGTGTAAVTTACGIRLDGGSSGDGSTNADADGSRGYQPKAMVGGYQATRLNGERLSGPSWIKIELVGIDPTTNTIVTQDVTADILSLGVTERAPFTISGYGTADSRSVVKLQRFAIPGVQVTAADTNYMSYPNLGGTNYNVVVARDRPTNNGVPTGTGAWTLRDNQQVTDKAAQYKTIPAPLSGAGFEQQIVPFPIEMFDTREGLYNDAINIGTVYGVNVPKAGVMSMVDIDVTNLKNFLDGVYNTSMPQTGTPFTTANSRALQSTDVPEANGWVLYISDRRGDADFDGEYDMEDIYGNTDGILQPGEDINNNNRLDTNFLSEAVRYTSTPISNTADAPALAASYDHQYYRRGVRLINGLRLPGNYDPGNSLNTKGFTVASENGVYVLGNYNAVGITSVGTPTPASDYTPQNTSAHVPASIVGDAVTILSNSWNDAKSFRYPFDSGSRVASETSVRFAMLSGDARSSFENTPNQGAGDPR
ncbi:MAG TPA: hypothetical protein VNB22_02245, partial [Pyrinomonadaceae bacterium]|nr:hypothetical protein [Pyrinomonadaceae bacterium]